MVEHSPGLRPAHSYRLYVRLLGYVRPYWRQFAASLLGMVVVAATEPAIPALFKPLLDQNFVGRDPGGILWMPLALMGLFLVRGLGDYVADVAAVAAALADADCLMVNRNQGAGTRVLIDLILKGVQPPGYWNQPRSHNAVAAAVVQGRADWGITPTYSAANHAPQVSVTPCDVTAAPGEPGLGTLLQGYTESSNVDAVAEITALIVAQRA